MTGQRCAIAYWLDGQLYLIGPIGPTLVDQKIEQVLKVEGVTDAQSVWLDSWYSTEAALGIPPSTAAAKSARYRRAVNRQGRPMMVDSAGTRRRLQALACLGWSLPRLEQEAGVPTWYFRRMCQRTGMIHHDRAAIVKELYDRLWSTEATEVGTFGRQAVSRTKTIARRNGYSPPAAWDDDEIDDPSAVPSGQAWPKDVAGDIYGRLKVAS